MSAAEQPNCLAVTRLKAGHEYAAPARRRPRLPAMELACAAPRRPRLPAWRRLVRGVLRLAFRRKRWGLEGVVLNAVKARGRAAVRELEAAAAERRRAPAASQEPGRQERQTWLRISCSYCARRRRSD